MLSSHVKFHSKEVVAAWRNRDGKNLSIEIIIISFFIYCHNFMLL